MTGTGFQLPGRRVVIGALAAALASGSLLGLVIGVLSGPGTPQPGKILNAAAGTTPTASSSPASSSRATASTSPGRTKTKTIKVTTRSPIGVPNDVIDHPENDRWMILATLQNVDAGNRDHIVLTVHPADLLTGDQAKQWYQSQGQQPQNTAVAPRQNVPDQQLVLRTDAALWGSFLYGDQQNVNVHRLSLDDFLNASGGLLGSGQRPTLWIKRSLGVAGDVVYVAEEHTP